MHFTNNISFSVLFTSLLRYLISQWPFASGIPTANKSLYDTPLAPQGHPGTKLVLTLYNIQISESSSTFLHSSLFQKPPHFRTPKTHPTWKTGRKTYHPSDSSGSRIYKNQTLVRPFIFVESVLIKSLEATFFMFQRTEMRRRSKKRTGSSRSRRWARSTRSSRRKWWRIRETRSSRSKS